MLVELTRCNSCSVRQFWRVICMKISSSGKWSSLLNECLPEGRDAVAGQISKAMNIICFLKRLQIQNDTKKTGTFEKPNKNWRNPRKKIIDRNWTITTCLLRDSNPNYQCLKITSRRWRPSPRMHSFEMRSGSERMHTWRRTPSTGRNFQTLVLWITVS